MSFATRHERDAHATVQAMSGSRKWYEDGIAEHYSAYGPSYQNPHEPVLAACVKRACATWPLDLSNVLDLAAGSGELTRALLAVDQKATILGADPFTCEAYRRHTSPTCEQMSFEEIAAGSLRGRSFSLIGCSFAMHLCPISLLPQLCLELAQCSPALLIFTPHKRPVIKETWGWTIVGEFVEQRVRARLYASKIG